MKRSFPNAAAAPRGSPPPIDVVLPEADALLIVPPFSWTWLASQGLHSLQASAREAGFRVDVLYANQSFAAWIGEPSYLAVIQSPGPLLGERLFARAAYGARGFEDGDERRLHAERLEALAAASTMKTAREIAAVLGEIQAAQIASEPADMARVERETVPWADEVARGIASRGYKVVGSTTSFGQTAASVALLARVKAARPEIVTIMGGANCEGEMAEAIASLDPRIDAVFSGESEGTFVETLRAVVAGARPRGAIIEGGMCLDLEALPPARFEEFLEQHERFLGGSMVPTSEVDIPYETGRGCAWGEKHPCRFCGFNGRRMGYRSKSPDKVIRELKTILDRAPSRRVLLVDNLVPTERVTELAGRLEKEIPGLDLFCEVRSDLGLRDVLSLQRAGVTRFQAGIESLSTSLLKRMGKGFTVRHNVALLRYARVAGLRLFWNLLWGFPGDQACDYEETIDLMGRMHHLQPPRHFCLMDITRFSDYFEHARGHGITNLRPRNGYDRFLPPNVDPRKLDCHFVGDFDCAAYARPDLIRSFHEAFRLWRSYWDIDTFRRFGRVPHVVVTRESEDGYKLLDTRGIGEHEAESILDRRRAAFALVARPFERSAEADWAVRASVAVVRDGWLVPLATARADLLLEFEDDDGRRPSRRETST